MALRYGAATLRALPRERVVAEYWYLCRRAARRFMRRGLERDDLEQAGAIGLIKAVDRYDAAHRTPFEAYAWLLVVGELMHYLRDTEGLVRAPRAVQTLDRRWSAAEREMRASLGREATDDEVARQLDVAPPEAAEVRTYRASRQVISLESLTTPLCCVRAGGIADLLDRLTVEGMLAELSPLQRRVVIGVHLEGSSIVELAARLGYSRRHITRVHRTAMAHLRSLCEVATVGAAEASRDVSLFDGG